MTDGVTQVASHDEIRLGIVGCGGISHAHARGAQASEKGLRFVACCDIREDVAKDWAERYGCESVHTDFVEMIQSSRLDGVLLATWPNQHREQIERCLEAGARHILCEKALTLCGKEAAEIWELVNSTGAFVMEGFMYRHHPTIRKLEEMLASGRLGAVDHVRAAFSSYDPETAPPDDSTRNWRQRTECGGGVPYDYACYSVNACTHFTAGMPVRAYATGSVSPQYGVINRLYGVIEYANGCAGIIESSKKSVFTQELQITCADAILELPVSWTPPGEANIACIRSPAWSELETELHPVESANPYQLQLENFGAVIRGEGTPLLSLAESVVNTFAIEALVTSVLEGRAVAVSPPDSVVQAASA